MSDQNETGEQTAPPKTPDGKKDKPKREMPQGWQGRIALFLIGFCSSLGSGLLMMPEGTKLLVADFGEIPLAVWLLAIVAGLGGGSSPDLLHKLDKK